MVDPDGHRWKWYHYLGVVVLVGATIVAIVALPVAIAGVGAAADALEAAEAAEELAELGAEVQKAIAAVQKAKYALGVARLGAAGNIGGIGVGAGAVVQNLGQLYTELGSPSAPDPPKK